MGGTVMLLKTKKRRPNTLEILKEHSFLFFLCISAVITILRVIFIPLYFSEPDDYLLQFLARDHSIEKTYLFYPLISFSKPLVFLYSAFSSVPWYTLFLLAFYVFSFASLLHLCWAQNSSFFLKLLLSFCCIVAELSFLNYFTYTVIAFFMAISSLGPLTFRLYYSEKPLSIRSAVFYIFLFLGGFSLRNLSALSVLALFAPVYCIEFFRVIRSGKFPRKLMVIALAIILPSVTLQGIDRLAYLSSSSWNQAYENNKVRSNLLDFGHADIETVEQKKVSLSENDLKLLDEWIFDDRSVYSVETLRALDEAKPFLQKVLDNLRYKAIKPKSILFLLCDIGGFLLLSFVLYRFSNYGKGVRERCIGIAVVFCLLQIALIAINRYPVRVFLPLWVSGVVALLCCLPGISLPHKYSRTHSKCAFSLKCRRRFQFTAVLIICACLSGTLFFSWRTAQRKVTENQTQDSKTLKYFSAHPDDIFLCSSVGALDSFSAFSIQSISYPSNILPFGSWMTFSPYHESICQHLSINPDSVLQETVKKDNVYVMATPAQIALLETYLKEHVSENVQVFLVENIGEMDIIHFCMD